MQYDPIKRVLGNVFNRSTGSRKLFYNLLDLLLLRAWHVHKELRVWNPESGDKQRVEILDAGAEIGRAHV